MYKFKRRLGDVMMSTLVSAAVAGAIGLGMTKITSMSMTTANLTEIKAEAIQHGLNRAEIIRNTPYNSLSQIDKRIIAGTNYFEKVTLTSGIESDMDVINAKIEIFAGGNENAIVTYNVKRANPSPLLYKTIGENQDGPMTQKAATDYFALKSNNVFKTVSSGVGSTSNPVYVNTDGSVSSSNFSFDNLSRITEITDDTKIAVWDGDTLKYALKSDLHDKGGLVEEWHSGYEWYRVYADGYCEQGGRISVDNYSAYQGLITMRKAYKDKYYTISTVAEMESAWYGSTGTCAHWFPVNNTKTNTSFRIHTCTHFNWTYWRTAGYIK